MMMLTVGSIKCSTADFQLISSCTAIYMLKGWAESSGASTELAVAKLLGLEVIFEATEDRGRAHTRASFYAWL